MIIMKLRSKECIDSALKTLKDHITIKINGSLISEDIFHIVVNMAVNRGSVHSVSKQYENIGCETFLNCYPKIGSYNPFISLIINFSIRFYIFYLSRTQFHKLVIFQFFSNSL